ncbi:hypothetical protein BD779DRAFT_1670063 [Infundibulicybe gibba]|nr:hypothetical protein BD779DRAFT_1670063 [Infundibulicybe gibba]
MILANTLSLAAAASLVAAHGYVHKSRLETNTFQAGMSTKASRFLIPFLLRLICLFLPLNLDPYTTPQPLRVVRGTKLDSGFIADPTSTDITCSIGADNGNRCCWCNCPDALEHMALGSLRSCPQLHGEMLWGLLFIQRRYGKPWFKIQQDSYVNGVWASDTLAKSNFTYTVKIPSKIAPGNYLLRHENLACTARATLAVLNSTLFVCNLLVCSIPSLPGPHPPILLLDFCYKLLTHVPLIVTGGGSLNPSGLSFPGTYTATDPGIHFNVYLGDAANKAYVPPGGAVYPGLN